MHQGVIVGSRFNQLTRLQYEQEDNNDEHRLGFSMELKGEFVILLIEPFWKMEYSVLALSIIQTHSI